MTLIECVIGNSHPDVIYAQNIKIETNRCLCNLHLANVQTHRYQAHRESSKEEHART